jgi:hypothetical protein
METILRKIVRFIRVVVVVFAALALALNGAASAQRLFSDFNQPDEQTEPELKPSQLVPGPSSEQQKENVNPPGKPNSEPAAYVSAPVSVESDNSQSRTKYISCQIRGEISYARVPVGKGSLIGSTSKVSTYLAGQFTLVGAKPSGTS